MPSDLANLTERQKKWFASVCDSLETRTGKSLVEWVAIAKTCPHDKPHARRDWLKVEHGLLQNSAALVLSEAFPQAGGWSDADALRDALWSDPATRATLDRVMQLARTIDTIVIGQRKSFTAFSRDVQFAAMRPVKNNSSLLGLKLDAAMSPRLSPPARAANWSERLSATILLPDATAFDAEVAHLFRQASFNG